jgi:hypothetical protein
MGILPFREPDDVESRFALVERRAVTALERSCEPVPSGLVPSFRLWYYPPVGPWSTWTLFVPPGVDFRNGAARVRKIRWDSVTERIRLAETLRRRPSLEPTLVHAEADAANEDVTDLLRAASGLGLALRHLNSPYRCAMLTEFGIEGFPIRSKPVRVEWGSPVPTGLQAIAAWHARARRLFDSSLPATPGDV